MATILLPPDFKEFLQLLNDHQVEYLLLGGYAVGYHGYPRATGDMDIWIAMHADNAERVVAALHAFGFAAPSVTPDLFLEANKIIRMGNPPLRIEVLTSASGVEFAACYAKRTIAIIDGVEVPIIALDDLKQNKQASGRLKDLSDLANLP
ncbi:MAG: nucleotidyltransferase family protein [Chloroflexaceae bacterium]|nr:nucleotidyltransferase family protein [Chloroflexaceae bacterium]NJO82747.1 nucleotidyltransferase family protein [Blastochloris sp.]